MNAVDYLLKPVAPERLAESLARAERQLGLASAAVAPRVIALRTPKQTVLVPAGEIAALRADGDFTHVFVADRPAVMIWRTLSHFEELLPAPPFLRLSRSLIIDRDRLRKIETPSRAHRFGVTTFWMMSMNSWVSGLFSGSTGGSSLAP